MNNRVFAKFVLAIFIVFVSSANSLHLAELRNIPESQEASNVTTSVKSGSSDSNSAGSVKGNIGSITSIISNPTQIINQIQNTVNTFLQTLNNTLSGSTSNVTSLLGSLKNITNKPSSTFRLEDADHLVANISELVKNSAKSEADVVDNATTRFNEEVNGAFQDFQKTIQELKSSLNEMPQQDANASEMPVEGIMERNDGSKAANTVMSESEMPETQNMHSDSTSRLQNGRSRKPNGLPRTLFDQLSSLRSQVDSRIQRSISNARSSLEDSLQLARQNAPIFRNQTVGFMSEMRRVFNEVSAPIRNFFEAMRRGGRPTAVVTA